MTRVNPTVYNSIASLSNEPNTTVVVFSGSDKAKLDEVFGNLNVWLAAENGIFMRPPPDEDGDQEVWCLHMQSPSSPKLAFGINVLLLVATDSGLTSLWLVCAAGSCKQTVRRAATSSLALKIDKQFSHSRNTGMGFFCKKAEAVNLSAAALLHYQHLPI